MDEVMSYNEYLYNKRKEMKMSKRTFAKFLRVPLLFYRYYENGYVKPSKKSIKKISEALNIDYSIYLQGISSYPKELDEIESRFVRWYRHLLSKKITKYILLITILFLVSSLSMDIIITLIQWNTRVNSILLNMLILFIK